jgi:hypothetical protein
MKHPQAAEETYKLSSINIKNVKLGMVVHIHNLSTSEAEAGGLRVRGQPGLSNEIMSQKQNKTKCLCIKGQYQVKRQYTE